MNDNGAIQRAVSDLAMIRKAIERARSEGLEVVTAVILVDRQEGGLDNIKQHVSNVSSIVTRDELVEGYKSLI